MTDASGRTLLEERAERVLAPSAPDSREPDSREPGDRRPGRPPTDVTRRERRLLRQRRRRRFLLAPALVLTVVVAGLTVARAQRGDDRRVLVGNAGAAPAASPPQTLLLAHRGPDGRADLAVVAGVGGVPPRGSVLLLPTGAQVETPSLGLQMIADLPRLGDRTLLRTTVENLLGVKLTEVLAVDDLGLLSVVDTAGTLTVRLPNPVHVGDGKQRVSYPMGEQRLTTADIARLLGRREQGDERDHLRTVQAVLEAWLGVLRDERVASVTTSRVPELAPLVAAAHAEPGIAVLPVEAAGSDGGERYRVDRHELRATVARVFPSELMNGGKRPRLQLLNGTGAVGLAQEVAACVVPAGYEVVLTDNVPGFGVARTEVIAQNRGDVEAAQRLVGVLGIGKAGRAARASDLFDVTVVIGADFQGCTPS